MNKGYLILTKIHRDLINRTGQKSLNHSTETDNKKDI